MSDTKINKQQLDFYKDGQGIEIEATGSESLTLKTPSGTYITMEGLLHAKQTLKAEVNTGHDGVIIHDAVLDRDTTPTTENITGGYVSIVDKNSNLNGRLYAGQNTTGVNVCGLYVPTNTTTASGAHLGIQIMQDGTAPCGYAPTPVASAAGNQIATASWIRSLLASSDVTGLAEKARSNGGGVFYFECSYKFSNGLLLQWGRTSIFQNDGTRTVTYPIPFMNGCTPGIAIVHTGNSPVDTRAVQYWLDGVGHTNFVLCTNDTSTATYWGWVALGYWKW